jgi:hypothetical protein
MTHEEKYKSFLQMIEDVKKSNEEDILVIHHPEVIGDNYEEIIKNLDLIAEARMKLCIVPTSMRGKK